MRIPFGPFALASAAVLAFGSPAAVVRADCPSNHTFVVTNSYDIDGEGIPVLTVYTGFTYTFELHNPSQHPFMLTASPIGGGGTSALPTSAGVACVCQGCGTCVRRSIVFTPVASLAGSTVYYQCTVHPGMGNAIRVLPAPAITVNTLPQPVSRCVGGEAEFIVSATSNETETLSYEWRRGGELLIDSPGHISGATTARLLISSATVEDQGAITCTVSAPCKTVTTAPVQFAVTVCCPADVGTAGGLAGSDGELDNNDFIAFINYFFDEGPVADMGVAGGEAGSDGLFDNNDFIAFIDRFFEGC